MNLKQIFDETTEFDNSMPPWWTEEEICWRVIYQGDVENPDGDPQTYEKALERVRELYREKAEKEFQKRSANKKPALRAKKE